MPVELFNIEIKCAHILFRVVKNNNTFLVIPLRPSRRNGITEDIGRLTQDECL